jgi:hypothetical protein
MVATGSRGPGSRIFGDDIARLVQRVDDDRLWSCVRPYRRFRCMCRDWSTALLTIAPRCIVLAETPLSRERFPLPSRLFVMPCASAGETVSKTIVKGAAKTIFIRPSSASACPNASLFDLD